MSLHTLKGPFLEREYTSVDSQKIEKIFIYNNIVAIGRLELEKENKLTKIFKFFLKRKTRK